MTPDQGAELVRQGADQVVAFVVFAKVAVFGLGVLVGAVLADW